VLHYGTYIQGGVGVMAKTTTIRARTSPELKEEVEGILKKLGLNTTEAINIFFSQIRLRQGLPFEVRIPNKVTAQTFRKTDQRKDLVKCKDADDMFARLGI
jgi:DNA-damage-inducible protein J